MPKALQDVVEDFKFVDRAERAELLIEFADKFESVPEEIATRPFSKEHHVTRCESDAYVWANENPDGTLKYYFAVENPQGLSAKALAAILDQTLSGAPLDQVLDVEPTIVFDLFGKDLSMGKGAGLTSMVGLVKALTREEMKNQ